MRVCFYTLGCKVNQNETGALAQLFEQNGFTVVEEKDGADVYVVNSCTVTNFGDQKSRKWLRRAKRENPGAVTVLTGCYPQAFPEEAGNGFRQPPCHFAGCAKSVERRGNQGGGHSPAPEGRKL